jgi:hypothetical protein
MSRRIVHGSPERNECLAGEMANALEILFELRGG